MSALSAPIYLKSLGSAVLRTDGRFVVTPKGGQVSPDRLLTFRIHLFWAAVLLSSLAASVYLDHTHVAMRTWAALGLAISLSPVAVWAWTEWQDRRTRARSAVPAPAPTPVQQQPLPEPAFVTTTTTTTTSAPATSSASAGTTATTTAGGN
ncbi:cellulose synthase (UDP-forming) OS=Streptomyces microflavus OX=1919 GN=Smic_57720 PE=4 SV=1 [Streptomyces microflavus]